MKKISFLFIFCSVLSSLMAQDFRKMAPAAGPAPKIEIGKYETFTLDNGLQVIVVENHKIPKVTVQVYVDTDPIMEGESAGYVDMSGELIGTGTKTRTKAKIDEEVDYIGASLSTSASGIFASSLTKHLDKLMNLVADVLLNPSFSAEEFDKLKKKTISGLQSQKDDANSISSNVGKVLAYGPNHPYGINTTEESVGKITLDQCKDYYNTYFRPNVSYLVLIGDINVAAARKIANTYFAKWQKKEVPKFTYDMPKMPAQSSLDFVNKPGAVQSVINITYPIDLKPNSPDAIKARVMNTMLGGYFRSRINDNLRESKGYTYGAGSQLNPDKVVGSFTTYGSFRNIVTDSSLTQYLYEINRTIQAKPEEKEMSMVKNVLSGNFARSLEEPETLARFALNIARYGLPKDYYETYLQKVSQVTADEVWEMAKKYLHPDNAHIIVVGNKGEVAEKMIPFAKNGKINYYDLNGKLIEDVKMTIPKGVTGETVIQDYINAIGGKEKLMAVKDLKRVASTEMQGMTLEMKMFQKMPDKFALNINMSGMVVQSQILNGDKGVVSAMGQTKPVEGEDLDDLKKAAQIFPELYFGQDGSKIELKGLENIEGVTAYQVDVTNSKGKKATYYFDMKTSLKIREVESQGSGADASSVVNDLKDYKEVNGIKFPFTSTISGVAPVPMVMKTQSVEYNSGIEDSVFNVSQ